MLIFNEENAEYRGISKWGQTFQLNQSIDYPTGAELRIIATTCVYLSSELNSFSCHKWYFLIGIAVLLIEPIKFVVITELIPID